MTLDDIAVPSNFLALKAIFRSMLPPEWTQRDGFAGPATEVNGKDHYIEIGNCANETESASVREWWGKFVAYAKKRRGTEIVWRVHVEHGHDPADGRKQHKIYGRLFISLGARAPCVPGSTFARQAELDDIAVPSNFLALKAIFRSMLPPEWTQRDGFAGAFTDINGTDEYIAFAFGAASERDAVRAWWGAFYGYAAGQGGTEVIWRIHPEHSTVSVEGEVQHRVYGRLCIPKAPAPVLPEHLPHGDVAAESP